MTTAADVVSFWETAGPKAWYSQDDGFDQEIRDQFGQAWKDAAAGTLDDWAVDASGGLGLIILLDQLPRNMFRDDPRAFATDAQALKLSEKMLGEAWDREIHGAMRQFIYMPFMHAENLAHQDLAVDLMETRMGTGNNDVHARAHRAIIERYGRFPYRNAVLERETTQAEQEMLDAGGYSAVRREFEAKS